MTTIKILFDAVRHNDVKLMSNIINNNEIKEYINVALVEASSMGHLDVIKYLLEEVPNHLRADIHFEENRAFLWAINHKQWHVVQYYLDKGISKEFNEDYLYRKMVQDENRHQNSFFLELQNNIKEEIDLSVLNISINKSIEIMNEVLSLEEDYYYNIFKTQTYYALKLLEKYQDYFMKNEEVIFDNNLYFKEKEEYFNAESCLKRYYSPITYKNNFQAFIAQILNQLLNALNINFYADETLEYLIKNRTIFSIKDEHIIQYLIEGNYDFKRFSEKNVENKFKRIISILIQYNVDFSSDKLGYLVQIGAINNLDEVTDILIKQKSNVNGFLMRYSDKNQWLNEKEQESLYDKDVYTYRLYDIYKKFDEDNYVSDLFLKNLKNKLNEKK